MIFLSPIKKYLFPKLIMLIKDNNCLGSIKSHDLPTLFYVFLRYTVHHFQRKQKTEVSGFLCVQVWAIVCVHVLAIGEVHCIGC